jgi:hypothetical protein
MKNKENICFGVGNKKGYGCKNPFNHQNSLQGHLCNTCYREWRLTSESGLKIINNAIKKAKIEVKREDKKETKERKIKLLTTDNYRKTYVQPIINEIARLIDYGQPCIATGNYEGKMAGGHYHSVGSSRTTALNLHNIHIQSFHSNGPSGGGDNIRYREGLIRVYGKEYYEMVENLKSIPPLHLSKEDLIEIKSKAEKVRSDLKRDLQVYSPEKRILMRDCVNNILEIYKNL